MNLRQYMKLMLNLIQVQEELKLKARCLKPVLDNMLKDQPAKNFIDSEKITNGFFYMFIYKDFTLRELITQVMRVSLKNNKDQK